ncbi:MAG TPA: hypothetical protein VMX76_03985 [Nevskiaceae bacterium]|nr:hypothetical protein [Nevskiaceae bacterium]
MTEKRNGRHQEPLLATERLSKPEFITRRISARKDLLHFVEGIIGSQVYKKLGKTPQGWIEELNIIHAMLTGENLVAGIGINQPPKEKPDFQKLGDNVFLYRGNIPKLRGVWLSKQTTRYDFQSEKEIPHTQWTHYQMGSYETLRINTEFADIPPENFLPENFEPKSQLVKSDRRPIFTFTVRRGAETITVYTKGAFIATSHLYHPPSYRLTNLARTRKTTSREEMERFLGLGQQGIKASSFRLLRNTGGRIFIFTKDRRRKSFGLS